MRGLALPDGIEAVIFDMDGVVTDTASVHAAAWKLLFDDYLRARSERTGEPYVPFDMEADYRPYVDGKPRYDGVRDFLASRGIVLPEGASGEAPDRETIRGLGDRKDRAFGERLETEGARAYRGTVELIAALQAARVHVAVISSSRNMDAVLRSAGVDELFEARVDGLVAEELDLPGKPDPAVFLEAARRVGVEPSRAVVVEDAIAGVTAGRAGGFALVVGVDRTGQTEALKRAGAHIVVGDLAELWPDEGRPGRPLIRELPRALDRSDEIRAHLGQRRLAVFLDYDGTLTPIVADPAQAVLPPGTREVLVALASRVPTAIVSGRDLDVVRAFVDVEGLWFAGSHGFDIAGPRGQREEPAADLQPVFEAAARELSGPIGAIAGAHLERKRYAIAVHYRRAAVEAVPRIERIVAAVGADYPELRVAGGKKIFELRPAMPWDKGRALAWLVERLGLAHAGSLPVYVGDDETDEDGFRALAGRGLGFVVRGEADARSTWADYALADPGEVRELLALFVTWSGGVP